MPLKRSQIKEWSNRRVTPECPIRPVHHGRCINTLFHRFPAPFEAGRGPECESGGREEKQKPKHLRNRRAAKKS